MKTSIQCKLLLLLIIFPSSTVVTAAEADATKFRNFLAGSVENSAPEEFTKLIYGPLPTQAFSPAPGPAALFEKMKAGYGKLSPLDVYKGGLGIPTAPTSRDEIDQLLSKMNSDSSASNRNTLVIVPGIFGEFIKIHAFEEVFSAPSPLQVQWKNAVAKVPPPGAMDSTFNLHKLNFESQSIEKLISVGTLNDVSGQPLVNLLVFNTPLLSLESVGNIRQRAAVFLSRLNKYFKIMGTPQHISFLGYSRGTMIGLEMLSQAEANPDRYPWLGKVNAMIAVGGVTYGSDLADVAMGRVAPVSSAGKGKPAITQQVQLLKTLSVQLQEVKPLTQIMLDRDERAKHVRNVEAILAFNEGMLKSYGFSTEKRQGLRLHIDQLLSNIDTASDILEKSIQANSGADFGAIIKTVSVVATQEIRFYTPTEAINTGIRKIKKLIEEALTGVDQLTTAQRLDWWAKHTIPTSLRYYAVAGTMMDSKSDNPEERAMATNDTAYNPNLVDFRSLSDNYRDFKKYSGIALNDSQVSPYKVKFWPEFGKTLNPNQPPYEASFLGVLGVHHWGMALEIVSDMKSKELDPYPRMALLRALMATVASND
ncbi:hypothetical protein K2X30_15365 [bacterium]|nr:hypothetical protein [bacterium]